MARQSHYLGTGDSIPDSRLAFYQKVYNYYHTNGIKSIFFDHVLETFHHNLKYRLLRGKYHHDEKPIILYLYACRFSPLRLLAVPVSFVGLKSPIHTMLPTQTQSSLQQSWYC